MTLLLVGSTKNNFSFSETLSVVQNRTPCKLLTLRCWLHCLLQINECLWNSWHTYMEWIFSPRYVVYFNQQTNEFQQYKIQPVISYCFLTLSFRVIGVLGFWFVKNLPNLRWSFSSCKNFSNTPFANTNLPILSDLRAPKFWRKVVPTYSAVTRQQIEIESCSNHPNLWNGLYLRLTKNMGNFGFDFFCG